MTRFVTQQKGKHHIRDSMHDAQSRSPLRHASASDLLALCTGERPREGGRATEAGQDAADDQVERPSATATETATASGWSRAIKQSALGREGHSALLLVSVMIESHGVR